jgi:hypothetical protein
MPKAGFGAVRVRLDPDAMLLLDSDRKTVSLHLLDTVADQEHETRKPKEASWFGSFFHL